jgi:WD40 repeat protein
MQIRLWPLPGNEQREVRRLHLPELTLWQDFAFDPGGRYLFAVGIRDQAWIIPLDDSPPRQLPAHSDSTFLLGAAASPTGRFVATAFFFGEGEKTLRVWEVETGTLRVFDLPPSTTERGESSDSAGKTGYERGVTRLHFADDSTLYTSGDGGIRRWDLDSGTHDMVLAVEPGQFVHMEIRPEAGFALIRTQSLDGGLDTFQALDLDTRETRPLPGFGIKAAAALDPSGTVVAKGSAEGPVRVGRLDGAPPHLLLGHEGMVQKIAISPDLKWIASAGQDSTLRLWPMPDLEEPPLHTLPHDELLATLESLTNLRAVRDPESATGWTIEVGPFPGWKEVPEW